MTVAFTKVKLPGGWLGNMAGFAVTYNGQEWRTTEALFQALRFSDPIIQEIIRAEKSPMGAKMMAKKHAAQMTVQPLSEQDLDNMRLCLRLKIQQHPELETLLLAIPDNEFIVEDVTNRGAGGRHRFWGAALVRNEGHSLNDWEGENTLGRMWMELRKELRKEPGNKTGMEQEKMRERFEYKIMDQKDGVNPDDEVGIGGS